MSEKHSHYEVLNNLDQMTSVITGVKGQVGGGTPAVTQIWFFLTLTHSSQLNLLQEDNWFSLVTTLVNYPAANQSAPSVTDVNTDRSSEDPQRRSADSSGPPEPEGTLNWVSADVSSRTLAANTDLVFVAAWFCSCVSAASLLSEVLSQGFSLLAQRLSSTVDPPAKSNWTGPQGSGRSGVRLGRPVRGPLAAADRTLMQ